MEQTIEQLLVVVNDWQTMGALAGLIALTNLLTNLTKLPVLSRFVRPAWRPWIAVGLGVLSATLVSMSQGMAWWMAPIVGLVSGFGSIGAHELFSAVKPSKVAERGAGKVVTDALKAPEAELVQKVQAVQAELNTAVDKPEADRLKSLANLANKM